ncbi:phage portal protein [Massilimicrobiota timonensis]|nr:phage portal protein [Massilimicrobiota timonensis]
MNRFQDFLYRFIFEERTDILNDGDMIIKEINDFKTSFRRRCMIDGERYYEGKHDILHVKRTVIGEGGVLTEVDNLPNHHVIDNQYAKMVNQKKNYLLGQPFVIQSDNEAYSKALNEVFNKRFMRMMKNILEDSLNEGISYLYVGYDEEGHLKFTKLKGHEVVPLWKDSDHTELDGAIRFYPTVIENRHEKRIVEKIEVYNTDGVYRMTLDDGRLIADETNPYEPYITVSNDDGSEECLNWVNIPIIPFKYNSKEIPLLKKVKSLQDGINQILSTFQNNMEEDSRNTILVLVNYDGQNLGEFRRNLAQYGAVKVRSRDGNSGDVKSLQVEVNAENYKIILELFKKALIENAMGFDAKDDRLAGNPNQMNIQSMYSDIDLDANDIETGFQASFEQLLWFINCHFSNTGIGNFENEDVEVIFNRDMLMNESEIIDNVNKSTDLSLETRLANHPWIDDVDDELEKIEKQKDEEMNSYINAFQPKTNSDGDDVDEE